MIGLAFVVGILIGLFALNFWLGNRLVKKANAVSIEYNGYSHGYVCHCEEPDGEESFQCETLYLPYAAVFWHLLQHDADYRGQCVEPGPSPTPSPSPEPSATPDPSPETQGCVDVTDDGQPCGWSPPVYTPPEYKPAECSRALPSPVTPQYDAISETEVRLTWEANDENTTHWSLSWGYDKDSLPYGALNIPREAREFTVGELSPSATKWFELSRWNGNECRNIGQRIDP